MPDFSYYTLKTKTAGIYKEKGSKFLSFAHPVATEAEIKEKIDAIKLEYFDARHHCYAWMLGADKKRFRSFDDGEPNHSAGDPILGQIRSRNLTNLLIVVVRYFGGVKLGVGGLISAYKAAAEDALSKAEIIEVEVFELVKIIYDHASTAEVMRIVKAFDLKIVQQDYAEECMLEAKLMLRHKDKFSEKMVLMEALGVSIKLG
jgi:uncharacterized YigZ family protein